MSEHTEGPWKLIMHGDEQYPYPLSIHTEDDACWIARDGTVAKIADARLIAAAPEMLAALKAMVLNDRHTYRDCHKAAVAAIARAEGRHS